jgi:hypothetical protein
MRKVIIWSCAAAVLFAGCTWVNLTPKAERVRIYAKDDIDHCRKLGQTTVSLLSKIGGMKRNRTKVAMELKILGRNSAAEMGGDTIVSASEIVNGEQTFDVYQCKEP